MARRQYDQNTTSEEQLRSFKIISQLQKQTTGSISPHQRKRYGTLIKAAIPSASIEQDSTVGFDSSIAPTASEKASFARTTYPRPIQPRALT